MKKVRLALSGDMLLIRFCQPLAGKLAVPLLERRVKIGKRLGIIGQKIAQPFFQPARGPACPSSAPRIQLPQLGGLLRAQID